MITKVSVITKFTVSVLWSSRSACQCCDQGQCVSDVVTEFSVSVLRSPSSVCQCYDHQVQCVSDMITKCSVSVIWSPSSVCQCLWLFCPRFPRAESGPLGNGGDHGQVLRTLHSSQQGVRLHQHCQVGRVRRDFLTIPCSFIRSLGARGSQLLFLI